jgi:SAM-dependent methyltransferase
MIWANAGCYAVTRETSHHTIVHLDVPAGGIVATPGTPVQGWLATSAGGVIERPTLISEQGAAVGLKIVDRPDVRLATAGLVSTGFSGWIGILAASEGPWRLRYEQSGVVTEIAAPLAANAERLRHFARAKARKLAAVRPLLRCPLCRATLDGDAPLMVCANGHRFGANTPERYDFLDDELRARVGAVPTENVSAHGYDETLLRLIAQSSGPIVDVGAGLRPEYREDVLNVEIVPYPTTDVVAASEYLPFADDSFDLLISVAVLEHVRDPFAAAREIERVLRPGGRVFAAVPFLQPYHAYPDHYYNMTAGGLRNLFRNCDVERLDVPDSGHPAFVLSWILRAWRDALPAGTASSFEQMRVTDLIADPIALMSQPFASELPYSAREQLAAINVLVGRKR